MFPKSDVFLTMVIFFCLRRELWCASNRAFVKEAGRYPSTDAIMNRIRGQKRNMLEWETGSAVQASLGFYIESMSAVKTSDMSFDMDMYFHLSWMDKRCRHNFSQPVLISEPEDIKEFWRPDLYFANAKTATYQHVTSPNMYLRIYDDGEVYYSARVTLNLVCNQNLRRYPLDNQVCNVRMSSYTHADDKLNITWFEHDAVKRNPNISLPEMAIDRLEAGYCNGTYVYGDTNRHFMIAQFSCLEAKIYLHRQIGYHLVQTFIPTSLIVIISWVSFFIEPGAVPARISLSFTTLLTLSTMAAGVRMSLPPVSYAKAIDVWMAACMGFVFLALLEFAVVNSCVRKANRLQDLENLAGRRISLVVKKLVGSQHFRSMSTVDDEEVPVNMNKQVQAMLHLKKERYNKISRKIDLASRFVFPLLFFVFNLCYWSAYSY